MTDRTELDSTDVVAGRTATLGDLLRVPLRRRVFPLVAALLAGSAAGGYLLLPATYEAAAVVAVRPVVTDPFSYPGPGADRVVNMTVENGLATGTQVVKAVSVATGASISDAHDGLIVELPAGSQVLRFRYEAASATSAVVGANAAANAYLQLRQGIYQRQRDNIIASYDDSIAHLTAQRDSLRKGLPDKATGQNAAPPAVTAQLDRIRDLGANLGRLTDSRAQAAAVDTTPGTITQIAAPPVVSSHDSGPAYVLAALLGGALLGAVGAFARESLDRRVRSAADVLAASRLPLLAELRGRRDSARLAADRRYLALALLGQLGPVPHRQIVLVSGRAGDLSVGTATGLAVALAEHGHTVRWDDQTADPQPAHDRILTAATGPVEETVSSDDPDETVTLMRFTPVKLEQRVADPSTVTLVRVGAGRIWLGVPTEADETLITIVRAEPAERDDHAVRVALEAAAVVMVRRDRTRVADLERLADRLRLSGAHALGVVLVTGRD